MPPPTTPTARPRAEARALRVLDDEPADAAWNMAADAALLELAAQPTLRLYGLRPHSV